MLVAQRHAEVREDERDDEDVVEAQRLLEQVAREEREGGLTAADVLGEGEPDSDPVVLVQEEDEAVEGHRERDPERAPPECLGDRRLVGPTVQDAEIEGQEGQDQSDEACPGEEVHSGRGVGRDVGPRKLIARGVAAYEPGALPPRWLGGSHSAPGTNRSGMPSGRAR